MNNQYVIREIARKAAESRRVGQSEEMPEPKRGFFVFDPEWARLKRKYVLRDNWYELYKESEQYAPTELKQEVRQKYRSFKIWEKPYTTWTDVAFGQFPEQLYAQMRIYNDVRNKVLPYLQKQGKVSNTVPGLLLSRTPPAKLEILTPGSQNKAFMLIFALGAFWIWMRSREKQVNNV